MKVHGLLLQRDGERREERRHDGRVAVDRRNTRWCSDGLEIVCDNGEKVRVAFALDCCDREAMGHVATTAGITAEDVRDLMVATVEHRYGQVKRVPEPIECLTDNGSCCTARDIRALARDIGLVPRTTPVSSPQSNGMAEALVRTLKRDYVHVYPRPDARTVIEQLPGWFAHYEDVHPHRFALSITPRIHRKNLRGSVRSLGGNDNARGNSRLSAVVMTLFCRIHPLGYQGMFVANLSTGEAAAKSSIDRTMLTGLAGLTALLFSVTVGQTDRGA